MALLGCGGRSGSSISNADDAGADDGSGDAANDGDSGVWTQCTAPNGAAVCRGPNACSADAASCACLDDLLAKQDAGSDASGLLSVCANDEWNKYGGSPCWQACDDDSVCVAALSDSPDLFMCGPFDLGVLFSNNGASSRVRYADMAKWTGDALPEPDTCPDTSPLRICGGKCGTCPSGQVCTGRSPKHPFGFCTPHSPFRCSSSAPCASGLKCFTFTVDAESQPVADANGLCLPADTCTAAAANLPGGGHCAM